MIGHGWGSKVSTTLKLAMATVAYYSSLLSIRASINKAQIWLHHFRLGHPSFLTLKTIFPLFFKELELTSFQCEVCQLPKHHRVSFPLSHSWSSVPLSLVNTDVWGPSLVCNIYDARWFVTFIDDCIWVTWLYLLQYKSNVGSVFPMFHKVVSTQFEVQIKNLWFDNDREYFNQTLSPFFNKKKESFINSHVLIFHNKIALLNGKVITL